MPDYTRDLHDFAALISGEHDLPEILEQALASLRSVVAYDLAAVFRLHEAELHIIAAAGPLNSEPVRRHSLELAKFPTIRRALETRRPIPLDAHDHHGEGDPYDGVLDLPEGHSCMVVPLYAAERSLGLITLDRCECGVYSDEAVQIAGIYGQLVSMALRFADQASLLDRYRHQLQAENRRLRERVGGGNEAARRLDHQRSPKMKHLARMVRQVAGSELPILVQGETGTGKELVAQAIHHLSPRADAAMVTLNCAALPESLVESELFGHVKGAFTGASRDRPGAFRTANGGTLLLDEVGELPAAAQAKLLRVLQEGTFQPVGSDRTDRVDVRVIAATHVDLNGAVQAGTFREDLYYRLAVFPLEVPPLRERREDIIPIAQDLLDGWARAGKGGPWSIPDDTKEALTSAPWPGNVRELRNALERATLLRPVGALEVEHLTLRGSGNGVARAAIGKLLTFAEQERDYLATLLERTDGKLYGDDGAAALAGLKPSTLRSKLVKHGLR